MCGCHFSYMRATSDIFLTSRYFQAFKHLRISQVYISRGLSIKHGGLTRANEFANNIYVLIIFKPNKKGVKTLKRDIVLQPSEIAKGQGQNFCLSSFIDDIDGNRPGPPDLGIETPRL